MADPVRDFLLDENGYWKIVNGDFAVVAGRPAVAQGISTRTKMLLGDSFLDQSVGVDYLGKILSVKSPDLTVGNELIQEAISNTPDVTSVISSGLSISDRPGRIGSVSYAVTDIYGQNPLTGETVVG